MEDIYKMKVTELRHELQIRGLDTKGLKTLLIDRLKKAMGTDDGGPITSELDHEELFEDSEEQPEESLDDSDNRIETVAEITSQRTRSPRKMGTPQKTENCPITETPEKLEYAEEVEQQEKLESPLREASLDKMESPQREVSPEENGSPQRTPIKIVSPQRFESQSSEKDITVSKLESPKKTEALKVEDDQSIEGENVISNETMQHDQVPASNGVEDSSVTADETKDDSLMDTSEVKEDVKKEPVVEADVEEQDRRGRRRGEKRSRSPLAESGKRYRPDRPEIEEVRPENEPDFDKSLVVLDWYSSDLSLLIEPNRLEAAPMHRDGFGYLWHSAKGTYGVNKGRVCFEMKVLDNMDVSHLEGEDHPHVVRVGWSFDLAGLILGEEKNSWGFGGTGKASSQSIFKSYGKPYGKGDVIGCFLDLESEPSTISYTINGEHFGTCYEMPREEIQDAGIFPHIMTKNCSFKVNFGVEEPSFELLEGFEFLAKVAIEDRILAVQGPEKKEEAEVIMMVGLPAAGKTTWAENYQREHPEKKFNILGTNNLIDRMKVLGLPRRRNYSGRWDFLIEKCTKALNKLLYIAYRRRRNYVIDQTNVYPSAQRRKMAGFQGFQRRAVVVCPSDDELKKRAEKRDSEEGKDVPERAVLEMKANYKFPEVGETFEKVEFVELSREEGEPVLQKYNKEGEAAGYGPKRNSRGHRRGGGDRRGYNRGGGYRGNWDRDRERKSNFDRRDRGNWQRDNRDYRSGGGNYNRDNRSGAGAGAAGGGGGGGGGGGYKDRNNYNRDRQNRNSGGGGGWQSGGGGGGGYRNQNQGSGGGGGGGGSGGAGYNQGGWNQSQQQQWGNQGWGSTGQGYNSGYNWNQQYYGNQQQQTQQQQPQQQQQQQQQPQQQTTQQYWTNPSYNSQSGYNMGYGAQNYGTTASGGYNYSQPQVTQPNQQQQWSGYGTSSYNQNYNTQSQGGGGGSSGTQSTNYNRK